MKKKILLSLLVLFSIQVMSQEKGVYLSLWGGAGPTGLTYNIEGVDFAKVKNKTLLGGQATQLLGGQAGLGFSYYFTKTVGITIGAGMSHYRTKAILSGEFSKDMFFALGNYRDNNPFDGHITEYELRVRTQNWAEYQSVKMLEIPLMLNFQKKFGEREHFGLYFGLGAKFQLPLVANYSIENGGNEERLMVSGYYGERNLELGGFNYDGTFAPQVPQHGFGRFSNPNDVLTLANDGKLSLKFNIAAVAEAGILVSLSRRVDIALGAFIDYGFMDINRKSEASAMFTGPKPGTDYVTGAENNVGNGITYNTILNSTQRGNDNRMVNKVSNFSYGGKLGLRVKLGKLKERQQPSATFAPCDKDTVYIYKFEQQPMDMDSLLKDILDALKDMPRGDAPIYNTYIIGDTTPRTEAPIYNTYIIGDTSTYGRKPRFDNDDDFDIHLPKSIPQADVDILFGPIYFDLDKSILTPKSIEDLDKKVAILKKYPEIKLIIFGNTCDLGNDPYNYKLGQRRAEAARNYLISKGIAAERLDSSTLSRFQPEKPNIDEPNRTKNRRDDFRPVYPKR